MDLSQIPDGWPGNIWLEGKTIVHLQPNQERPTHMPRGPAKKTGGGFLIQPWHLLEQGLLCCYKTP